MANRLNAKGGNDILVITGYYTTDWLANAQLIRVSIKPYEYYNRLGCKAHLGKLSEKEFVVNTCDTIAFTVLTGSV